MEELIESEKLENLLNQMKQVPILSGNMNNMTLKSTIPRSMHDTQSNDIGQGTDFDKSKFFQIRAI